MKLNAIFAVAISILLFPQCYGHGGALLLSNRLNDFHMRDMNGNSDVTINAENELSTCEEQLTKYRKFMLQAIISFEDICDAYNQRPVPTISALVMPDAMYRGLPVHKQDVGLAFVRDYQPTELRSDIWGFFKLMMAQFEDVEFSNVIRNTVIERCRFKSQLQRDEKRNSVVLGKKQRFHSWGGKRSQDTRYT